MKWYIKIILISMLLLPRTVDAQDKLTLQKKYDRLQQEISDAQELLQATAEKKRSSLDQLKILNRKVSVREELVRNLSLQVLDLSKAIQQTVEQVSAMEANIGHMREDYARMVYYAYVNDTEYEPIHFLFASGSINNAFTEMEYVREYTTYRKEQAAAIQAAQAALRIRQQELEADKSEKEALLAGEEEQRNILAKEKAEKDSVVQGLKGEEKQLLAQIDKKKKDASTLNKQIQQIIAEEIRKEKERAEAAARAAAAASKKEETTTSTTTAPVKETPKPAVNAGLTPEMALISSNFAGNKGRLPWPVERGTITGKFGTQPHAALRNVTVENNGIDITTQEGAQVRSVFEGEVVNVIFNPSFQKGVIIKHGEYYTVYTGLTAVQVKAGDKITTKQVIGTAYTRDDNQTEIHLEIWKGTTIMDPAGWITK
jgi:murein hydrolase activator